MSQLLIYPFISLSIDIVRWLKKSEREWLYFWNLWVWNDLAKSYFEFCVKVVTHKLALEQHPSGVNSTLQCLWNRIPVPPTTLPPSQIQLATWHSQAAANTAGSVGRSIEFMVVLEKDRRGPDRVSFIKIVLTKFQFCCYWWMLNQKQFCLTN